MTLTFGPGIEVFFLWVLDFDKEGLDKWKKNGAKHWVQDLGLFCWGILDSILQGREN